MSTLLPLAVAGAVTVAPVMLGSVAASASPLDSSYGPTACTVNLQINPGTLQDGSTFTVNLSGTCGDQTFTIEMHSTPVVLGNLTTSASGSASGTFSVPANLTSGTHTITAANATGNSAVATVAVAGLTNATPAGATPSSSLPHTGVDSGRIAAVGAAAVGAGGLLVLSTRKRRARSFS